MKAGAVAGLSPQMPLREAMAAIVRTRLQELLALGEQALEPAASTAQHDTRIAAKRLRYLLEIGERCLGPEAAWARKAAKRLQGVLGELHDCDVMLPRVAGRDELESMLRARREARFHEFRELWGRDAAKGTWDALAASLPLPTDAAGG